MAPINRKDPRYTALLAAASALILVGGYLLKPVPRQDEVITSPPSASETARLQRLAQRQSIDNFSEYFANLSASLESYVVRLGERGGSAVFWDRTHLASGGAVRAANWAGTASAGERKWPVRLLFTAPHLPASSIETVDDPGPPPLERVPLGYYHRGAWLLAMWRFPDGSSAYATGQLMGPRTVSCEGFEAVELESTLPFSESMSGGGVFDMEGSLVGLITNCEGRYVALDVDSVNLALERRRALQDRLISRYGFSARPIKEIETRRWSVQQGLTVEEVWRHFEAADAGLRPGDVIVESNGKAVREPADIEPLVLPIAAEIFELKIRRGRETKTIRLRARAETSPHFGPAGALWAQPPNGLVIDETAPDSLLAEAGARSGDRILSINGVQPRSPDDIAKAFGREEPVFLVLARGEHRWGTWAVRN